MITLDPRQRALDAVASAAARPATAILFDSSDVRLVVFRIAPGQRVAPHQNPSTVTLTVLSGEGLLSGREGERLCSAGDVVVYDPGESHGMRATDSELHLLAAITPRPGARTSPVALAQAEAV
jgi:quercetin dioxygenase-like cupin family protein